MLTDNPHERDAATSVSVLHIESDAIVVDAVREWTKQWPEVRYVGSAFTGKQGIDQCALSRPSLVLLEMSLPDMNGFEIAEALSKANNGARLLILTHRADDALLHYVTVGLASGLLWKLPGVKEHLRNAIAEIFSGRAYFPRYVHDAIRNSRQHPEAIFKILSPRELALLPFMGRGESDSAIGTRFRLSAATVHSHRQRMMAKLGLHGTPELMRWANRKGFSDFPRPSAPMILSSN